MKLTHEIHGRLFLIFLFAFVGSAIILMIFKPPFGAIGTIYDTLRWILVVLVYGLFVISKMSEKLAIWYQRFWNLKD